MAARCTTASGRLDLTTRPTRIPAQCAGWMFRRRVRHGLSAFFVKLPVPEQTSVAQLLDLLPGSRFDLFCLTLLLPFLDDRQHFFNGGLLSGRPVGVRGVRMGQQSRAHENKERA